jgi:hypothetical protein
MSGLDDHSAKVEALAARPGTPGEGAATRSVRLMAHLPLPPPKTMIGLRLRLDGIWEHRESRCDRIGVVHPGRGPHKIACGKRRGWIEAAVGDLRGAMRRDGRLSAAPILCDGETVR